MYFNTNVVGTLTARQPPAGPAVAALEVERGQDRLTNGRARRGAAGQSARNPSGAVDRRHPESGSTRSGVGRDDLRRPPRLVEGRINEGSGFSTAGRGEPRPRAAGILGQLPRVRGQTSRAAPRGASARAAGALERGRPDAVIAGLLFVAGMRRSEVSALRWADVGDAADGDGGRGRDSQPPGVDDEFGGRLRPHAWPGPPVASMAAPVSLGGPPAIEMLSHVSGDGDHGVPLERGDAGAVTSAPSTAYGSQRQPSRWSGSRTGWPPVKMTARLVVTWSKRAGSSPSTSTAPAAQLPARPMLRSPSGPVRVSRASVRRVPSTKATRRGRSASVGRCATNAPPSSTSSHSTACGESSDAWKPAP